MATFPSHNNQMWLGKRDRSYRKVHFVVPSFSFSQSKGTRKQLQSSTSEHVKSIVLLYLVHLAHLELVWQAEGITTRTFWEGIVSLIHPFPPIYIPTDSAPLL